MCTNGSNVYLNTLSILTALKQANDDHSYDQSISVLGVLGVLGVLSVLSVILLVIYIIKLYF